MLDRLEALARAADDGEDWFTEEVIWSYSRNWIKSEEAAYIATLEPAVMLKLIAVARAAQALADSVDEWTRDVEAVIGRQPNSGMATAALRLALAELDRP